MSDNQEIMPAPAELAISAKRESSRYAPWLIAAAIAAALIVVWAIYKLFFASDTGLASLMPSLGGTIDLLSNKFGINRYLSTALAIVLVGMTVWIEKLLGERFGFLSKKFAFGTAMGLVLYFLAIWWLGKDVRVDHSSGKAMSFYAIMPDGKPEYFDSPGFHPRTGVKLQSVTQEILIIDERRKRGLLPKELPLDRFEQQPLFDPATGTAKLWYGRSATGEYRVYIDGPGFDPQGSGPLPGVTAAIADQIKLYWKTEQQRHKGDKFAQDGRALRFYAITPNGVEYFDAPGHHPQLGIPLKPVTPEVETALARKTSGQLPKEVPLEQFEQQELFDPVTSAPKIWYSVSGSDDYRLYRDGPGFDPKNQELLKPITSAIADDIRQNLVKRRQQSVQAAAAARIAQLRLAFDYKNSGELAIAVMPVGGAAPAHAEAMANQLAAHWQSHGGSVNRALFRQRFYDEGHFTRAFSGDLGVLREADALKRAERLLFAELQSHCDQGKRQVSACDVRLRYRLLANSGQALDSGEVSAHGIGFDASEAMENGIGKLSEQFAKRLITASVSTRRANRDE